MSHHKHPTATYVQLAIKQTGRFDCTYMAARWIARRLPDPFTDLELDNAIRDARSIDGVVADYDHRPPVLAAPGIPASNPNREDLPPFEPTDFRSTCPRCNAKKAQATIVGHVFECTKCAAVYFACPGCGSRSLDKDSTGRPTRCKSCSRWLNGPMIV